MQDNEEIHVVIGATGGVGSALVRELVGRGRRVRAVSRRGQAPLGTGVEALAGDASDQHRMREVCRGADVVYNAVNPPFAQWQAVFPAAVDGVLAGAEAAGARLVFVDDTWMYGRVTAAMTEDMPYRPVSNKGVLRAWLAERVLAAHSSGRVRTVIGRAPELYGPRVESLLASNVFAAARSGRRALWVGAIDQPLAPMFINDFAYGLAELGAHESALGQAWHLPTPQPSTARRFIETVFAQAAQPLKISQIGEGLVRALGVFWPIAREGAEMLYQFRQPHVVDASKYLSAFRRAQVTSYDDGIKQTLEWYQNRAGTSLVAQGR